MNTRSSRPRSKKILLAGDSRIRHMDLDLNAKDTDFAYICKCLPGANLKKVVQSVTAIIRHNNTFSLIIIFAGINDVTQLIRKPLKFVRSRFLSVEDTVEHLQQSLNEGLNTIKAATQIPVAFCPIIGLSLPVYSPQNSRAIYQQPIVEESVLQVNQYIYSLNVENHVPTPHIESTIHKCKGRSRRLINHYDKLHDGCHPDPQTRAVWADIIHKAAAKHLEL